MSARNRSEKNGNQPKGLQGRNLAPKEGAANVYLQQMVHEYDGRCGTCYMRQEKCICASIPKLDNKTKLTVIMHHRESHKTTNTARLAHLSLTNSQIILRGLPHQPLDLAPVWDTEKEIPLFLTLSDKSEVLTPELLTKLQAQHSLKSGADKAPPKSFHLIVPDGNWRQASKMGKREKSLQKIQWVKLPPGPPSRYRLRHEHLEEGMATMEAIARAIGIIENSTLQNELEQIFELMVERTLETRPTSPTHLRLKT
jgi:DTW domain-containing protein